MITRGGLELPRDAVVIGAGVRRTRSSPSARDLTIGERGGIACSSRLETSTPGVFAAGDVCEYDSVLHGGPIRIEHWDVAFNHGKTAALNMLGRDVPHTEVPYFFSVLAGIGELEYVGPASSWDEEILRGSLAGGQLHQLVPAGRPRRRRAHVRALGRPRSCAATARREADARLRRARRHLGDLDADLGAGVGFVSVHNGRW